MTRRLFALLSWLLLAAVLYVGVTFGQVWWTATHDEATPSQAIVVLGAAHYDGRPSPVFQARLDHAATLYRQGLAPRVVVTGGQGSGDSVSEGWAGYTYLTSLGVPDEDLQLETGGRTSYESLAASARFLARDGIADVILVSDGWHLRRSVAIADEVGLQARPSPAPGSPYSDDAARRQMLRETAGLAVGQIIGFRRLDRLTGLAADESIQGAVTSAS
ncbi:YdcF family protein [Euzebya tangerina]|uniref:YdcF family protein n=1 Tax=Euzebya tangerina TaxID=591198 RepID=UPI0013C333E4|nr:YdcF family protein [Euzebya tangerina]